MNSFQKISRKIEEWLSFANLWVTSLFSLASHLFVSWGGMSLSGAMASLKGQMLLLPGQMLIDKPSQAGRARILAHSFQSLFGLHVPTQVLPPPEGRGPLAQVSLFLEGRVGKLGSVICWTHVYMEGLAVLQIS